MGRNNWFEFKQFRIEQHKSAMKVGTDGVLLGAWTPIENAQRILDAGTGTGLIALMLAQRADAFVEAVEIDEPASTEAEFNFQQSEWNERLRVYHADFQVFANEPHEPYDLIVSNPPFFINSLKNANAASANARHNDLLSFGELIAGAYRLLSDAGRLCVIIPFTSCIEFREFARLAGFYLKHQTLIIPKAGRIPKRVLLEFSIRRCYPVVDELIVLDQTGTYTDDYKNLTAPYYPAF